MSTTSEIVERLRKPTVALEHPLNPEVFCYVPDPLCAEAAEKIDELERENAKLREMFALLPKAASEAMISAAEDAASDHFAIDGDKGAWLREDGYKAIWQAMTVAALAASGEK
jgi:hypothetical protein